ncbi:MAG: hypothetical protein V7607_5462 [Solirubrobacteraceae bacterium]
MSRSIRKSLIAILGCVTAALVIAPMASASSTSWGYTAFSYAGKLRADSSKVQVVSTPLSGGRGWRTSVSATIRDHGPGDGGCGRIWISVGRDDLSTRYQASKAWNECRGVYRTINYSFNTGLQPQWVEVAGGWTKNPALASMQKERRPL